MFELANIGIFSAFLAGIISFLSPCVLPLVPGYVSFVAGRSLEDLTKIDAARVRLEALSLSLCFVLGFSLIFVILGASASLIGDVFQSYRYEAGMVAGGIIIVFGIQMMGLLKISWINRDWRLEGTFARQGTLLGAFVLGAAFAFGWTPCIGPILGSILTLGASSLDVTSGAALLGVYSIGLAIPFLLVAAFTSQFMRFLSKFRMTGQFVHKLSGGILVLVGFGMVTGTLNTVGTWLLNTFPGFQNVLI